MPELVRNVQTWLTTRFPDLLDSESQLRQSLQDFAAMIQARGAEFVETVLSSAVSLVNVLVLIVIVPVVTFYLLLDWDNLVARIDALLPRDHAPTVRKLAAEIDRTLSSFVRGQGTVCLILGIYYAAALALVGLNFGLVVGFIAGALTFIPYVGALVGGVLAIGLALFQFWGDWWWIVAVWAIFQSGQFVEGNILTPNLVGSSVGLHPVWLIFALSAFGALFGFVGLLVAVPVAAIIGVLVRFGLDRYRESMLYRGVSGRPPEGD
jgi:predicted PurR-regulated permease PerM